MNESLKTAQALLAALHRDKPDDKSNLARRYAIAITEAEKLYAWIETWLYDDGCEGKEEDNGAR
jgi:hypothetical protein